MMVFLISRYLLVSARASSGVIWCSICQKFEDVNPFQNSDKIDCKEHRFHKNYPGDDGDSKDHNIECHPEASEGSGCSVLKRHRGSHREDASE
jgi:hypothetical protein